MDKQVDKDIAHLNWIHDRLEFQHKVNHNVDYMHALRRCIANYKALADELRGKEWQPILKMPKEYKDDEYFLTRIEHWRSGNAKYVVGRMEEDGFYFSDRDELSMDWNPTQYKPIQPPKED